MSRTSGSGYGIGQVDDKQMAPAPALNYLPELPQRYRPKIGLIGAGELALLKPTAFLVNTARASLTDEQALYEVLRERRIAGAALDVFLQEPLTACHPLARLDNVLATPHLAGATREVVTKHSRVIARNIQAYASRLPLPNLVNPEALGPLAQTDHG